MKTLPDGTQVAEFSWEFPLDEGKAAVELNADGGLIVEGYAADFQIDRMQEAFEPGAFNDALDRYLKTNAVLLYHHKKDTALGQVLDARIDENGLHIKALVDEPEPGTIIADYYRKIKSGTIKGFSVGGQFHRRMTPNGPRIYKCDLGEISMTPYPCNPNTLASVAGKAFEGIELPEIGTVRKSDLEMLNFAIEQLESIFNAVERRGKGPQPDSATTLN